MDKITLCVLLLIVLLILHLLEEVHNGFRKKLPRGEMPLPLFVGLNILIYTFCAVTLISLLLEKDFGLILSTIFASGMVLNAAGHLVYTAIRRIYFPGAVTAALIFPLAVYLLFLLY